MCNNNDNSDAVEVPQTVYQQLETLRTSGNVNMFTEIKAGLRRFGLDEAHEWVDNNREKYRDGFMGGGFTPIEEDNTESQSWTEDSHIHYEMSWNGDGVSISKYKLDGDGAEVALLDEWWYTWTEVFTLITEEERYAPDIV